MAAVPVQCRNVYSVLNGISPEVRKASRFMHPDQAQMFHYPVWVGNQDPDAL